jgi:hypothetical protein
LKSKPDGLLGWWPGEKDKEAKRLESMIDLHLGDKVELKKSWKLDWLAHADQWAQDELFNFFGGKVGLLLSPILVVY